MSASCTPTLTHLQCKNVVLSTTATKQLHTQERRCGFRVFLRMEQAVEFEPTDSLVFMLNTIANNIAQRNANYLTTLQNVSISISGFTNRPVNPFSQACFNLFMLFKTFTFDSFDRFSSSEFLATKARCQKRNRIEEMMPQAFVMFHVIV